MTGVLEKRAQAIVPGTAGGFTVPEQESKRFWEVVLSDKLLQRITIYEEENGVSNSIVIEDQSALGNWVGEGNTIPIVDAIFANCEYPTMPKVVASVQASIELLDDANNLGAPGREIIDQILANRLRRTIIQAVAAGTGVGQPLGLFTPGAGLSEVIGPVTLANLLALMNQIDFNHIEAENCAWVMNPWSTWTAVLNVIGSQGWLVSPEKLNILGFPVILTTYAAGANIVFGNLAYYGLKRLPNLVSGRIRNSPSNALSGQETQYVWTRAMGKPVESASSDPALAILKPS